MMSTTTSSATLRRRERAPLPPRQPAHGSALAGRAHLRERGVRTCRCASSRGEVGVSHGAPRRHFPDRQALLDALAEPGFERLGAELRRAVDGAGEDFETRLRATAAAYVRFATRDAALLELMFAGKHGEQQSGALHEAAERAFSVMLELIEQGQAEGVLEPGEPERVGLVLFATIQGIAALVTGGMVEADQLDELVADASGIFCAGRAPPRARPPRRCRVRPAARRLRSKARS